MKMRLKKMVHLQAPLLLILLTVVLMYPALLLADDPYPEYFENDSDNTRLGGRWGISDHPRNVGASDFDHNGLKDLFVTFPENERLGMAVICERTQGGHPVFYNEEADIFVSGDEISSGCTGVIFADFNNDGYSDFYAPNTDGHQLFRYNPTIGQYENIADEIIDSTGFSTNTMGGAWGDYNGDGWIDLLILKDGGQDTSYDRHHSNEQRLLINNEGTFTLAESWDTGIDNTTNYIVSALWADFSGDGWVDLALIEGKNGLGNPTSKYFKNDFDDYLNTRIMSRRLSGNPKIFTII